MDVAFGIVCQRVVLGQPGTWKFVVVGALPLPEPERRGEDREPVPKSYDVKAMGHESISDTVFDVVGIGAASIDELLWVARYPEADSKIPVLRRARRCGGIGATSLVAAAQLGSRAAFAGILDTDE